MTLRAGEALFRRDAPADRVFLVTEGRLDLLLDDETGNRTRVETALASRLVGLSCAIGGAGYAYSCVADSSEARVLALPSAKLVDALGRHPDAAKAVLAETSARLRRTVAQLSDLKLKDSVQRLAGYLVELCAHELGAAEVILPAEKRVVADRLGMKPETLSRALARLEGMGLAHMADSARVRLPDVGRLRRLYWAGPDVPA